MRASWSAGRLPDRRKLPYGSQPAAAVGSRDDFQQVAARILEVDAAPTVVTVDLPALVRAGSAQWMRPCSFNAGENLVELPLADQEGVVLRPDLALLVQTPFAVVTTWNGPHFFGDGRPSMPARNVAAALLSRDQTMVWLNSTLIAASSLFHDRHEAAENHALAVEGHRICVGLHARISHGGFHAGVPHLLDGSVGTGM